MNCPEQGPARPESRGRPESPARAEARLSRPERTAQGKPAAAGPKFRPAHLARPAHPARPARRGRWLWLILLLALWEVIRRAGRVNPLIMPSLWAIAKAFVLGLAEGTLAMRWLMSLAVVGLGITAGTLLALGAVRLCRLHARLAELFHLLSSLMHPLPGLALLPLVILWFGVGLPALLAIIVHAVLWPVFVNLDSGIQALPESWKLYTKNLEIRPGRRFYRVELPGAFPYMISGLRTAWARSWRAFIASEMVFGVLSGSGGLGRQLFESRVMMDTPALYAALLAVMITGLLAENVLLTPWEDSVRRRWEGL